MFADNSTELIGGIAKLIGVPGLVVLLAGVGIAAIGNQIVGYFRRKYGKKQPQEKHITAGQLLESVSVYSATTLNQLRLMEQSVKDQNEDLCDQIKELSRSIGELSRTINEFRVESARRG